MAGNKQRARAVRHSLLEIPKGLLMFSLELPKGGVHRLPSAVEVGLQRHAGAALRVAGLAAENPRGGKRAITAGQAQARACGRWSTCGRAGAAYRSSAIIVALRACCSADFSSSSSNCQAKTCGVSTGGRESGG